MSKFGDAFAAARKAGKAEFTFNGKKYHTKTKEEMADKGPTKPKSRPDRAPKDATRPVARTEKAGPKTRAKVKADAPASQGPTSRPKRTSMGNGSPTARTRPVVRKVDTDLDGNKVRKGFRGWLDGFKRSAKPKRILDRG